MDDLLTVSQVAEILKLHQVTVRRLILRKKIKAAKIGGRIYVRRVDIGLGDNRMLTRQSSFYGDLLKVGKHHIGVWGTGYIGFSTLVNYAVSGVKGLGYDIDATRTEKVKRGEVDIPGLSQWLDVPIKNLIAHQLIDATNNCNGLLESQPLVHFICIPTEMKGEPWLEPLRDVTGKISSYLVKTKCKHPPLIVIESTLTPGISDREVLRTFTQRGLKLNQDYLFAVAPRRDWFVDREHTLKNLDRIYGAPDEESARQTESVLSLVCEKLHRASNHRVAEMVKSVENAYRHMDITLANQLTLAYPEVSMREVLRLVGTKWNMGIFYPSFGTGGYCIPLASKYVIQGAEHPEELTLLKETIKTDSSMPKLVAKAVAKHRIKSVGILGLSYRGNMKVPHQSPTIGLVTELKKLGVKAAVHDPYFNADEIRLLTDCGTFQFPDDVGKFEALAVVADHAEYLTPAVRRVFERRCLCRVIYDNVGIWQNLTYFAKRGIKYFVPGDAHWLGI